MRELLFDNLADFYRVRPLCVCFRASDDDPNLMMGLSNALIVLVLVSHKRTVGRFC